MRQSQLFTRTKRENPTDEASRNAQLLLRAGYIYKEMAGVYAWLPLGLRVINKIKKIVAEEMEAIGSQEIIMTALQNKEIWEKTGRWDDEKVDIWFKTVLKSGTEVGLGWSHEEPIIEMMKSYIISYQDLPKYVHQFQTKLRNEVRAKSGVMRGREFVMKDMYSFCATEEAHMDFYKKSTEAYLQVYRRLGLGDITYVTSASGGAFTDNFSHEFQTLCEAGEDVIYVHKNDNYAVNEEIFNDQTLTKLSAKKEDFEMKKSAEVGNIFTFGTEKCEQMGLSFTDTEGKKQPVYLGSYGVGVTRLVGVITEIFSDEKGIVWPREIAPFMVHLIGLGEDMSEAENVYNDLISQGVEVLFDDRLGVMAGEKFADADLLGMPLRIVVSKRSLENGGAEIKGRTESESKIISLSEIVSYVQKTIQ
jgi:prolyl-tRNA synthetase